MPKVRKILKWLLIVVVGALIGLQFVRPVKTNPAVDQSKTIQTNLQVTPQVAAILDRSCQDCHGNDTRWPWYSNVSPVSWTVIDHVNEGRKHLNLSEWGSYDKRRATKKLEQMCDEVKDGAMPIPSYTWIHRSAKLSADDIKTLCDWTAAESARLDAQ
ncbi:MAG: heme-binding domain-containing protein [Acidobacteriota bacterium]